MNYTRRIASIDANCVGGDEAKYYKKNRFASELLINTWAGIIRDVQNEEVAHIFVDVVKAQGIIPVIRQCANDADTIINNGTPSDLGILLSRGLDLADSLQLLRYGKRFSPEGCDGVKNDTLKAFLQRNNLDKMSDRRGYPVWLTGRLRDVIAACLSEMVYHDPYSCHYYEQGYFSNGAIAEEGRIPACEKAHAWDLPFFGSYSYPSRSPKTPVYDRHLTCIDYKAYRYPIFDYSSCDVQLVNKSYKACRVIAKENVVRSYYMQGFRKDLEEALTKAGYEYLMPSEHQDMNQMLAHIGSVDGYLATVDLSAASDSIPVGLIFDTFPKEFCHIWYTLRSSNFIINGKAYTCYMANTSGSPLCFSMEKILFYAFARVATDIACSFGAGEVSLVTAMGDDIIVPSYAVETLADLLSMCGIVTNLDKSFSGEDTYRESCGYEADSGYTTTSLYFPRKTILDSIDSIDSVISLQQALFRRGYYTAARVAAEAANTLCGRPLTYSTMSQYVEYGYCPDLLGHIELPRIKVRDGVEIRQHDIVDAKAGQITPKNMRSAFDMYVYTQYLIHGPLYLSDLDRLLGVTSSRLQPSCFESKYSKRVHGDGGHSYE